MKDISTVERRQQGFIRMLHDEETGKEFYSYGGSTSNRKHFKM